MDIKSEKELIEWVYDMHLQNLSGRENFADAFKEGIEATIEELKELKFLNLPVVVGQREQLKSFMKWHREGFNIYNTMSIEEVIKEYNKTL